MTCLESLKISSSMFVDYKLMRYYEYMFNIVDEEYKRLNELGYLDRLVVFESNMIYEYIVDKDSILYSKGIYQINIEFTCLSNNFILPDSIKDSYIYGEFNIKYKIHSLVGNCSGLKLFNTQLLGSTYIVDDIKDFIGSQIKLYHNDNIIYNKTLESLDIKNISTNYTSDELLALNINKVFKLYYSYDVNDNSSERELLENFCNFYKYNLMSDGLIVLSILYDNKIRGNKFISSLNVSLNATNLYNSHMYIIDNILNITIRKIK